MKPGDPKVDQDSDSVLFLTNGSQFELPKYHLDHEKSSAWLEDPSPQETSILKEKSISHESRDAQLKNKVVETAVQDANLDLTSAKRAVVLGAFWFGILFSTISITSIAPFYPLEAVKKNFSLTVAGFVVAVFYLGILVTGPFVPKLIFSSVVLCTLKPNVVITGGLVLAGLATVIFGFSTYIPGKKSYLSFTIILRFLNGGSSAAFIIIVFVVTAMLYPDNIATSYSVLETAVGLGCLIGPSLGDSFYSAGGFFAPFALLGVVQIVVGAIIFLLMPSIEKSNQDESLSLVKFMWNVHPIICCIAVAGVQLVNGFLFGALEPFLSRFHVSTAYVSSLFAAEAAAYAFTSPLWGYLNDLGLNPHKGLLVSYLLSAVGMFLIGPSVWLPMESNMTLTIAAVVICGLGEAGSIVNAYNALIKGSWKRGYPEDRRTYVLTSVAFNCSDALGLFVGTMAGGYAESTIGLRSGSMVIVGVEVLVLVLFIAYNIWSLKKDRQANSTAISN